jgi:tetratricopeptide (TPR) repeat protein
VSQLSKKIDALFATEKWKEARALIEKAMKKRGHEPDHWLLTRLATTYYEERRYKNALQLVEKARVLAPECPLVLWDYAGTLDALGRSEEAVSVYMALILRGPEKIGRQECGEGLEWAIGLLTDCFYRASVCLKHLHRPQSAWKFFLWYAQLVAAGAQSIYAKADSEIIKHILEVGREHPDERPPRSPRKGLKEFAKQAERLLRAA